MIELKSLDLHLDLKKHMLLKNEGLALMELSILESLD